MKAENHWNTPEIGDCQNGKLHIPYPYHLYILLLLLWNVQNNVAGGRHGMCRFLFWPSPISGVYSSGLNPPSLHYLIIMLLFLVDYFATTRSVKMVLYNYDPHDSTWT